MSDEVAALAAARGRVLVTIADACHRADRDPASVTLVAVSKTVPPDRLRAAVAAGLDRLGENRVQEGLAKIPEVPGATWELVGPLQANKARKALTSFVRIQTVDSLGLARRLNRIAGELGRGERYPVLLEVNVDADPAKSGYDPAVLEGELVDLVALPNLRVEGLMTIGRQVANAEDARPTFRALRELSERLRAREPGLGADLSMGMTDDYAVAIEEGATTVRVGRAIFGERPDHGR